MLGIAKLLSQTFSGFTPPVELVPFLLRRIYLIRVKLVQRAYANALQLS